MRNPIKGNAFSHLILPFFCLLPALCLAQRSPARFDTLLSLVQNQLHAGVLQQMGLSGKGVRIAVLDAGFLHANQHPALAQLWEKGDVIDTWDFVDQDSKVTHHSNHGTQVLSALAGQYGSRFLGFAPGAEYLLYRTEHERKESISEEEAWIAALHRAEAMGADIVVSSVNFTYARYDLSDLNGETISVSKAAAEAAARGILLVVAMGNEGDKPWRFMGAPADVPAVLSVGATMPGLPMRLPFSSVGPNAKGVAKPELAAPGYVLVPTGKKAFTEGAGTSFAAPLIAGIAACLLEQDSTLRGEHLYQRLCQLGHLYPYYDYEIGFGVPDLRKLLSPAPLVDSSTFRVFFVGDTVFVRLDSAIVADSAGHDQGRVLYYHLLSADNTLAAAYQVRIPSGLNGYYFLRRRQSRGLLRVWFEGYLWESRMEMME